MGIGVAYVETLVNEILFKKKKIKKQIQFNKALVYSQNQSLQKILNSWVFCVEMFVDTS